MPSNKESDQAYSTASRHIRANEHCKLGQKCTEKYSVLLKAVIKTQTAIITTNKDMHHVNKPKYEN